MNDKKNFSSTIWLCQDISRDLMISDNIEAVVRGQNPVKWLKKVISTIDILSQGRTRASHNFQPASNFGKKSKRFSKMGEIERQNYNMEVLETVYPDNFRSYKHKISSLRAAVLEKKKKQKFEDGYKLFLNLLDEIPEAIPETRETTFFDLDMVKEFRGGWFSRFEKALSAFDYNSRETLAARSGEIKSALENNLKAVARRELTGFYDYQKWLTCLCRQRIDVSLESREIDAVNREIRRDKVAREKEAFLNSLDNPDFVDRLFDNPIYLKGVISDCLREGIPFELVRVKKAVLAKFADDFSTLVNLEYLQKLDEVAKVLGFVSSRDEEVTEFLEKSDDPILRSLASKQLATPEASTQQPNKVSDNADAFADFVATSIMKYFYSNNLFTPEIQSKFGVASFWLGLRNNVSIAYRSLRLFGRAFSFVSATERSEIFEKHFRNKAFPGNIFIAPGAYLEALGLYLTTGEQAAKARIVKALENGEYNFIESVLIALLRKYHRVENAESHRDENFKILELTSNATKQEVIKAYRRLARRYHPDMPEGDSRKFNEITQAYDELIAELDRKSGK